MRLLSMLMLTPMLTRMLTSVSIKTSTHCKRTGKNDSFPTVVSFTSRETKRQEEWEMVITLDRATDRGQIVADECDPFGTYSRECILRLFSLTTTRVATVATGGAGAASRVHVHVHMPALPAVPLPPRPHHAQRHARRRRRRRCHRCRRRGYRRRG